MALTFEQCRSCGGRTQIDIRVPPERRRCMLCGGPCSRVETMEIPEAGGDVEPGGVHVPAKLVPATCPHCEGETALDPGQPFDRQTCNACGLPLETPEMKGRMRKRSLVSPDGLLIRRPGERIWMPIAGIMLAFVFVTVFAIWMFHRPATKPAPHEDSPPPDDRESIKELTAAFAAARSPEELLPLIREPEKFKAPLQEWCAGHPGLLPLGGGLFGRIGEPRNAFGVTLRQARVAWQRLPPGFLLVVSNSEGWRVDWRAFTGIADLSINEFIAKMPATPVLLMAVARRSDYYNGTYTDKETWESLYVCDSAGDHPFYAYAHRADTALLKALEVLPPATRDSIRKPGVSSRRLALRMMFRNPESAALRQAEVTGAEGDGWYVP